MSRAVVYIALQQFGEHDTRPMELLVQADFEVRRNQLGRRLRREDMVEVLRDADAVLAGVEPYDGTVLAALPKLRCISRCGVGTDSIDLEAATRCGITVYTTIEEVVEPVAQMTLAMILALARNIPLHLADTRGGHWKKHPGVLLSEWTIGLVGFGRIGRAVARYLGAFGPRLLVTDPKLDGTGVEESVEFCDLPTLLANADLVTVHANRSPKEGVLLGQTELRVMKPGSFLVNTSRGFLVDEAALYDALMSGHLAGAALDVFENEPYAGALTQLPHVCCTPHVATLTRASRSAMEYRCVKNVMDYFEKRDATIRMAAEPSPHHWFKERETI